MYCLCTTSSRVLPTRPERPDHLMQGRSARSSGKQIIQRYCGVDIVSLDIGVDSLAICDCCRRPEDFHRGLSCQFPTRGFAARGKFIFDIRIRNQFAGIGGIQARSNLFKKPGFVIRIVLLTLDVVTIKLRNNCAPVWSCDFAASLNAAFNSSSTRNVDAASGT